MSIANEISIRALRVEDAAAVLRMRLDNREAQRPYEPLRPDAYFTLDRQRELIEQAITDAEADRAYTFGIYLTAADEANTESSAERLVGRIALTNVSRGAAQHADIGYFVDFAVQGRGIATAAVRQTVDFAFRSAGLHRIQAGVMPRNAPSLRVLAKCGFRLEGTALRYIKINGEWEDHHLFAVTAEEWPLS